MKQGQHDLEGSTCNSSMEPAMAHPDTGLLNYEGGTGGFFP
jgi:hypothetical protein